MIYLVGGWPTLWKMMEWKSVGMMIPNIWKNKKRSKTPICSAHPPLFCDNSQFYQPGSTVGTCWRIAEHKQHKLRHAGTRKLRKRYEYFFPIPISISWKQEHENLSFPPQTGDELGFFKSPCEDRTIECWLFFISIPYLSHIYPISIPYPYPIMVAYNWFPFPNDEKTSNPHQIDAQIPIKHSLLWMPSCTQRVRGMLSICLLYPDYNYRYIYIYVD